VRRILAETRREHAEEKKADLGLAAPLLREEKRQAEGECPSLKTVVGSVLGLTAVAEAIALAVVLTKKSNGEGGGDKSCVEPTSTLAYWTDVDYSGENTYEIWLFGNVPGQICDELQFVSGAKITDIVSPASARFESTLLPGIGFAYKVIFPGGLNITFFRWDNSILFHYDRATSIGPVPGVMNIYPPQDYPVIAYMKDRSTISVPISGRSACTRSPLHNYTNGGHLIPSVNWDGSPAVQYPNPKLTSLFYSFGMSAKPDGTVYSLNPAIDTRMLYSLTTNRLRYPSLKQKTYLVIGGDCSLDTFGKITHDNAAFTNLKWNLLKLISNIDAAGMVWDLKLGSKCPGSFNETLFVRLHEEMAETLQPFNKKLHSIFPASNQLSPAALCKVGRTIDTAHLMTFNYANFLGGISGDAAGLDKVVGSVQNYLHVQDRGNPCLRPDQILVGSPSFGRGVAVTNTSNNYGYGQPVTAWLPDQFGGNSSIWSYNCIIATSFPCENYPPGMVILPPSRSPSGNYSAEAWAYQPNSNGILSFDTPYSICKKIQFVKADRPFADNQPLSGYFLYDTSGDTYEGGLTNAADTAFSTKGHTCSDSTAESMSEATPTRVPILPPKVLEAMAESAEAGSFYGFLYELHRRGLTDLLSPQGYSPREIYCIEKTLQTVYNLGSLGCAAPGVSLLLVQLGLPKEAVDKAVGNTALAAGLWFAFWPTVGCIGGSIAGSMVAAPCYHYVVKPAARAIDATMATAVSTVMAPLGNAAGALAGAAAKTAYEAASRASKSWVGTAVGTAAITAVGIAGKAADRYRKSWLGSAVSTAATPVGTLSEAVLKAAGTTRVGIAVGAATSSARASFWARASPALTSASAPPTAASSGESLAIELAK